MTPNLLRFLAINLAVGALALALWSAYFLLGFGADGTAVQNGVVLAAIVVTEAIGIAYCGTRPLPS